MNADLRLKLGFALALVSTAVSLYFSEVMNLPPCSLCWYQRICMYPLVAVFGIGLLKTGREAFIYAVVLSYAGLIIAIYHCLLYYGALPETIAPCKAGVSCTQKQLELFGFVTIPLMSLVSFGAISALSTSKLFGNKNEK
jgi:disulfide bond formation protein DsbB